jgi:DNA-binding transcriptional MerR regulator
MIIGPVEKLVGLTVEAIRFSEKEGLIEAPSRTSSGYRNHSANQTQMISFSFLDNGSPHVGENPHGHGASR